MVLERLTRSRTWGAYAAVSAIGAAAAMEYDDDGNPIGVAAYYDSIARDLAETRHLSFRVSIEQHTARLLLPKIAGKAVADLACGEGFYARFLRMSGADPVVGVDISPKRIEIAKARETAEKLGIEYVVADIAEWESPRTFDICFSSYLLCQAHSEERLLAIVRGVRRCLEPGGVFVGITDNPDNDPADYDSYRPYGFIKSAERLPLEIGDPITYHIQNADGSVVKLDNYYIPPKIHERVFARAGFEEFAFVRPRLDPASGAIDEPGFWDEMIDRPPIIGFAARAV